MSERSESEAREIHFLLTRPLPATLFGGKMVAAFPLGKLLYLGVKQMSKPIARRIQERALHSPFIRTYICSPPAQLLHRMEVFVKMRLMGVSGPTQVKALSQEKAVQIGAEIIGEMVVYTIASSAILAEYIRSSRKGQVAEESQDQKIAKLHDELHKLDREVNIVKRKIHQIETEIPPSKSKR